MKQYQKFAPRFFTWENLIIFFLGSLFGYFSYAGGSAIMAASVGFLYVGTFIVSNRVAFNNENIEALHEEIEELKKNK